MVSCQLQVVRSSAGFPFATPLPIGLFRTGRCVEHNLVVPPEPLEQRPPARDDAGTVRERSRNTRNVANGTPAVDGLDEPQLGCGDRQKQIGIGMRLIDEHRGRARRQPLLDADRLRADGWARSRASARRRTAQAGCCPDGHLGTQSGCGAASSRGKARLRRTAPAAAASPIGTRGASSPRRRIGADRAPAAPSARRSARSAQGSRRAAARCRRDPAG